MIIETLKGKGYNVTKIISPEYADVKTVMITREIERNPFPEREFSIQFGNQQTEANNNPIVTLSSIDTESRYYSVSNMRTGDVVGKCGIVQMDINNPYSKENGIIRYMTV